MKIVTAALLYQNGKYLLCQRGENDPLALKWEFPGGKLHDGEDAYAGLVRELREAKTRRQFLFSTHNANIPVFGDAEWIGVLSASENRGALEYQGSIDVPEIREQAEQILEGGREAFARRREMYEL